MRNKIKSGILILLLVLISYSIYEIINIVNISISYKNSLLADDVGQGILRVGNLLYPLIIYPSLLILSLLLNLVFKIKFVNNTIIQICVIFNFWMKIYRINIDFRHKIYFLNEYYNRWDYHISVLLFMVLWCAYLYLTNIDESFIKEERKEILEKAIFSTLVCGIVIYFGYELLIINTWMFCIVTSVLFIVSSVLVKSTETIKRKLIDIQTIIEFGIFLAAGGAGMALVTYL